MVADGGVIDLMNEGRNLADSICPRLQKVFNVLSGDCSDVEKSCPSNGGICGAASDINASLKEAEQILGRVEKLLFGSSKK